MQKTVQERRTAHCKNKVIPRMSSDMRIGLGRAPRIMSRIPWNANNAQKVKAMPPVNSASIQSPGSECLFSKHPKHAIK